jgi:hypothetical protein
MWSESIKSDCYCVLLQILVSGRELCTCRPSDAQVSLEVEWRFSERKRLYLPHCNEKCIYSPPALAKVTDGNKCSSNDCRKTVEKPWWAVNAHHSIVAHYLHVGVLTVGWWRRRRGLSLIEPCSTAQRKKFLSYWALGPV